jgi:HSP20 family protein
MAKDIARRGVGGGGLFDLRNEIDRLFEDFFAPSGVSTGESGIARRGDFVPRMEVNESDKDYLVRVELPGMKADEVNIDVNENVLTVRGERRREVQGKRGGYDYTESSYGTFLRSVQLPPGTEASKIEAKLDSGILEIVIPKTEESRPRTIPVKATGQQAAPEGSGNVRVAGNGDEKAQSSSPQPQPPPVKR